MRSRLMLIILLVLLSLAEQWTRKSSAQGRTYTDPFAYCAALRTIDAPDARYVGVQVPDAIALGLHEATQAPPDTPLDQFVTNSFWRCMDDTVYASTFDAHLPCEEQANSSQTSTPEMATYCHANPNR